MGPPGGGVSPTTRPRTLHRPRPAFPIPFKPYPHSLGACVGGRVRGGRMRSIVPGEYRHNMHKDQKGPLKIILKIWPKMLKNSKRQNSRDASDRHIMTPSRATDSLAQPLSPLRLTLAAQSRVPAPLNPRNCQSPPNRPFGRLRPGGSITPNSLLSHDRNAPRAPFTCPTLTCQPVIIHPLAVSALTTAPTYESY